MISFPLGSASPMIAELDLTSLSSFGNFHELLDPTNNRNKQLQFTLNMVQSCILNLKSFLPFVKDKFSGNGGVVKVKRGDHELSSPKAFFMIRSR